MKNTNLKFNKTKLVARLMLITLLLTSTLTLASCGKFRYEWEVYTHKEFVEKIEEYNSSHNLFVDTFISFDLDDNPQITKSLYSVYSRVSPKTNSFRKENGYIYDKHNETLITKFVFYLDGIFGKEYGYKIKCNLMVVAFNFTENDKIEILKSECAHANDQVGYDEYDTIYEETLLKANKEFEQLIPRYTCVYHYSIYVDDVEICCIHISSMSEATEEKLSEIIQMLSDSLVVLNTEKYFIWRDNK